MLHANWLTSKRNPIDLLQNHRIRLSKRHTDSIEKHVYVAFLVKKVFVIKTQENYMTKRLSVD